MNVHDLVFNKIAELTRFRVEEILLDHTLLGDIRLDEDDFSFLFVPELEAAIGRELPQADWNEVRTVGDVIRMIERKLGSRAD